MSQKIYKLTRYRTNKQIETVEQVTEPKLEQLQELVGGFIEEAPDCYKEQGWFEVKHNNRIDAVWCNEGALMQAEPKINPFFEQAPWGDWLYGDVLVVEVIE